MNAATLLDARDLYTTWAEELAGHKPIESWERISNQEQAAWLAVLNLTTGGELRTDADPECDICHRFLACPACDDLDCPVCRRPDPLMCEDCWLEQQFVIPELSGLSLCMGESR